MIGSGKLGLRTDIMIVKFNEIIVTDLAIAKFE